jgi:hypothetical protein
MANFSSFKLLLVCITLLSFSHIRANEVEIVDVKAHQGKDKTWSFAVTLKHADEGWDHYANEWQVIAPDDKILATRTLYHPHVDEQPFTRNTSGVKIPEDIESVRIIARDTIHGHAKTAMQVNLKTKVLTPIPLKLAKSKTIE